jgi:ribosomal-protein-alanine N-acetyltransferase
MPAHGQRTVSESDQPYPLTPADFGDLDRILEIEQQSFGHPWSRRAFEHELGREAARLEVIRRGPGGPPVAYVAYWLTATSAHLTNLATLPGLRRRGLARRLIRHVEQRARLFGLRALTLEVRPSNAAARALYAALGFSEVGVRPGYYENGEDALLLALELG